MKLFNRRKKVVADPTIPPEVQAYSQAEHRERMGMAWLIGAVTLVLTAFILVGLFFGGRWLYRTIAGPSKNDTQTQQPVEKEDTTEAKDQSKDQTTTPTTPAPTVPAPTAQPVPATSATNLPHTGPDSDE